MEVILLLLIVLLLLTPHLVQMCSYLRKGAVEFGRGLKWYLDMLDDATMNCLVRILTCTLGVGLLWLLGIILLV
jgi:hypothetical protein